MQVGKNHRVTTDEMNVILSKRLIHQKTGEEYWTPLTYHATLRDALNELVRMNVNKTGLTDLQTVVDKMDETRKLITAAIGSKG